MGFKKCTGCQKVETQVYEDRVGMDSGFFMVKLCYDCCILHDYKPDLKGLSTCSKCKRPFESKYQSQVCWLCSSGKFGDRSRV